MERHGLLRRVLTALAIPLSFGGAARADFVYTFNTTQAAPTAGSVGGTLTVRDEAVESGQVLASDIDLFSFSLMNATAPFTPTNYSGASAMVGLFGPGPILVDSQTGAFLNGDIIIVLTDLSTGQQLQFQAAMISQYSVQTAAGNDSNGMGTWAIERVGAPAVPEPSTLALGGIGLACLGAGSLRRRRASRAFAERWRAANRPLQAS